MMDEKHMAMAVSRREVIALLAGFTLAAAHQYLFYGHSLGLSVPIFVVLFYAYLFLCAGERIRRPFTWFGWLSFAAVLLLSMTYALFANPVFHSLNVLALPCLILLQTTYILSPKTRSWGDLRMILDAFDHLFPQNLRHFATFFNLLKSFIVRKMGDRSRKMAGKVLLGLLIALPLLIIVVSLLTSADSSFERLLSGIPDWLNRWFSFGEIVFRLAWIVLIGLLLFGYLWGFVSPRPEQPEQREGEAAGVPGVNVRGVDASNIEIKFDPVITATVLIVVNIVYLLFVSLQFSYLFGAWRGMLPEGSTYAEYARSGFLELVFVTAINFAILIGTLVFSGQAGHWLRKWNNWMLYILVGCSCVMLVSAYTRLIMYEQAYGYTYIRFLVHAFMIFLALLFLCAGLRIYFASIPLLKCFVVIGLVAYVAINYANMDRVIATKNMELYKESGTIDARYLTGLSADVVPQLIRFSRDKDLDDLNRQLYERWEPLMKKESEWPSFNAANSRAVTALKQNAKNAAR
ncbi:DUF4153 domain-containing protein [Fontibacillus sp. BL9]|uniref:DUF4153 domain-containing protein n=1 Tax=Fontibacillus sp. BL9 TaxID=3389971 RepID=UPI00397AFAE4